MQYEVKHYERNGIDIYQHWLDNLKDIRARATITRREKQIKSGNFGEHRECRDGVWELVIDTGPGYRVYYSMVGRFVVLLLCAGDKSEQQRDINKSVQYLKEFKERNKRR